MSQAPSQTVISGTTRFLGMLGDPVSQVRSPQIFNPRIAAAGHDAVLVPLHIRAGQFDAAIGGVMAIANLDGLVLTMPFKERIVPRLAAISERARQVGAANAARRTADGAWEGDMFDGVGLIGAVRSIAVEPKGLAAGLIGAGGAGSAIAFALAAAGVESLVIHDHNAERARGLAERVAALGTARVRAGAFLPGEVALLVNATPVGMKPDDGPPLDTASLTASTSVVDIVTRQEKTALLRAAEAAGCRHAGGAAMVAAQTEAMLAFFGLGPVRR